MPPASKLVFLNCPYDTSYTSILQAVVFAVLDCGFVPRCALENQDGSQTRLQRIYGLISVCELSIHDISYAHADPQSGLAHFNVAFELGLFLACKEFGGEDHGAKRCLILDSDPDRYHKSISDISGQDIQVHGKDPDAAIRCVRNWLSSARHPLPGAKHIQDRYVAFRQTLPRICEECKLDAGMLTYEDFCHCAGIFLRYFSQPALKPAK